MAESMRSVHYLSTQEVVAGGSRIQVHPQLHKEPKTSIGYMTVYLKINNKTYTALQFSFSTSANGSTIPSTEEVLGRLTLYGLYFIA